MEIWQSRAPIGIPLALLGDGVSLGGTLISAGASFYSQGRYSPDAWKSIGFFGAGLLGGELLKKVPGLSGFEEDFFQQTINIHLILFEKLYDFENDKK